MIMCTTLIFSFTNILEPLKTLILLLDNDSIKENLLVLFCAMLLSGSQSIAFSMLLHVPKVHTTIKLFTESVTKLFAGFITYFAYLLIRYQNENTVVDIRLIFFFLLTTIFLGFIAAYRARTIVTDIESLHDCEFKKLKCLKHETRDCSHPEILDPETQFRCVEEMRYGKAAIIVMPSTFFFLISFLAALVSSFLFYVEPKH